MGKTHPPPVGKTALSLCVLGSLPCPLQSVLLALLHARIPRQQSRLLQRWAQVRVVAAEGAGDAVRDRPCLAAGAAADDLDRDVELPLHIGHAERCERRHLEDATAEICERVLVVDRDAAFARRDAHARDRVLAAAGASVQRVSQSSSFLLRRRTGPSVSERCARGPRRRRRGGASAYPRRGCCAGAFPSRPRSPGTWGRAPAPWPGSVCAGRRGSPYTACTPCPGAWCP